MSAAAAGVLLLLAGPGFASAAGGNARPTPPPPAIGWFSGNRVRLTVSSGADARTIAYTYTVMANGELRIEVDDRTGKTPKSGEMLLVGARFLGTRGLELPKGYEIDTLDTAVLSWQVAGRLLERGVPGDPARLAAAKRIDVREEREPLLVSTTSAEETFRPPWTARGHVNPLGDGRVYFEVAFAARPADPSSPGDFAARYSGTWERLARPGSIPGATSLSGWTVYALGPYRRRASQGGFVDYGATPVAGRYATLDDLRRAVAAGK